LKKTVINTLLTNAITFIIGFTIQIIISRVFGPELTGSYFIAVFFVNIIFAFFSFSLSNTFIYIKKKFTDRDTLPSFVLMSSVLMISAMLMGLIFVYLFEKNLFSGCPVKILFFFLLEIPFFFIVSLGQGILFSEERIIRFNAYSLTAKIILLAGTLSVYHIKSIYIPIAASILSQVILALLLIKKAKINLKPGFDREVIAESMKYGFVINSTIVITLLHYRADVFLINMLVGTYFVGIYSVAVGISERIWILSNSISTSLFPKVVNVNDEIEKVRITNRVSRISNTFSFVIVIIMEFFADSIISIFFKDKFIGAISPMRIILPGIYMIGMSRLLSNYLSAVGKQKVLLYTKFTALAINIYLNLLLIPQMGINGAALSTLITYLLSTTAVLIYYCRKTKSKILEVAIIRYDDIRSILKNA